jgi:hypothetical protein
VKLRPFMTTPELCGGEFGGPSWTVHREVLAPLWDGDPIAPEHQAIARETLCLRRHGRTVNQAGGGDDATAGDLRAVPGRAGAQVVAAAGSEPTPAGHEPLEW